MTFTPDYQNIAPWCIQPGEPLTQYQWFEFYLKTTNWRGEHTPHAAYRAYRRHLQEKKLIAAGMPADIRQEQLDAFVKTIHHTRPQWLKAEQDYDWSYRVEQYEHYCAEQRCGELNQRGTISEDKAWVLWQDMMSKMREILKYPLTRQTVVESPQGRIIIIEPTDWKLRDIAVLLKAANKLAAIATQSRQKPQLNLLLALELLVEEGCLPPSVLHQARLAVDDVPRAIAEAFKHASGMDTPETNT
jgi:hypothetical protein